MVDVTPKRPTERSARASGFVAMRRDVIEQIRRQALPKGDVLTTAKLAGIQAAKRTAELIPLCHVLALTHVDVGCEVRDDGIAVTASVKTTERTGVEMEALTAAAVACLTMYDMCKAADPLMEIGPIRLEEKTGGRSDVKRGGPRCR
ncbi:MAG: cyclic pyranopterin monophosphate synthase MoaC [Candidatus Omnitrophica bacterium]|nr:cyclic pyranopterin monophosphate synthase MoaC [Candidatus Omnitrophota bacterium]